MIQREWLQFYEVKPSNLKVIQSWDISLHDESVCMTWEQDENICYLVDIDSTKRSYGELKEAVINLANDYNPDAILIEDDDVSSHLRVDLMRYKLPFISCQKMPEKIWRFASLSGYIETGKVRLPKEGSSDMVSFVHKLLDIPYPFQTGMLDAAYRFLRWATESKNRFKMFKW